MRKQAAAKREHVDVGQVVEFLGSVLGVHTRVGITDLYQQGHALGRGGCGIVHKVQEKATGMYFACKTIVMQ